jgi:hypothetical protein
MRRTLIALTTLAGTAMLGAGVAAAFPVAPIGPTEATIEKAAVVCNQWGRCWRTGPRYYRYGYGPRRYYGPRYGYYGGPYYGPGVSVGGPGFGLRFGF